MPRSITVLTFYRLRLSSVMLSPVFEVHTQISSVHELIYLLHLALSLEVQKANRAAFDFFGLTPFYPQCKLDII
jgi:hypothetical protein